MSSDFYKSRLDSIHENETNSDENNEVCDFIKKTHLLQTKDVRKLRGYMVPKKRSGSRGQASSLDKPLTSKIRKNSRNLTS